MYLEKYTSDHIIENNLSVAMYQNIICDIFPHCTIIIILYGNFLILLLLVIALDQEYESFHGQSLKTEMYFG